MKPLPWAASRPKQILLLLLLLPTLFTALLPQTTQADPPPASPDPTLLSASSRGNPNGIVLAFSQAMDPATALNPGAYQLNDTLIHDARFGSNQNIVLLETGLLTEGALYSVTANNLFSTEGLLISPNPSTAFFEHGQEIPGTYLHDFDDGSIGNATLSGSATLISNTSGGTVLELTPANPNLEGSLILQDINLNKPVYRFHARFDVRLAEGSPTGGEGFSFCFAPDLPPGPFNEEGAGTGLTVSFDPVGDSDGLPSSIDLKVGGIPIAQRPVHLKLGDTFVPVSILLHPDGTLYLSYDGILIYSGFQTGFSPTPGRFGFGAATRTSFQSHQIDNIEIRLYSALGPVTITTQPSPITVSEGQVVTFKAAVDGTPPHCFQWQADGVVIPGATNPHLTLTATQAMNNRRFSVAVNNEFSSTVSQAVRLALTNDLTAPHLVRVTADPSFHRVIVTFSERVLPSTATDPGNYSIPGLTLLGAELRPGQKTVHLATSTQSPGSLYHLSIRNIRDLSSNGNVIPPDTSAGFSGWIIHPGLVLIEFYEDLPSGSSIDLLTTHPQYPHQPSLAVLTNTVATPYNQGDAYGARISGYFTPPGASPDPGPYLFHARGDDTFQLRLSPNQDPASASIIIDGRLCCQPFSAHPSPPQTVTQAPRYFEGLLKEDSDNDYFQAAVKTASDPTHPDDLPSIPSRFLSTAANPDTAGDLFITLHPRTRIQLVGETATFTVQAQSSLNRPLFHQWQRRTANNGFEEIPGANGTSYTTPRLTLADGRSAYRCVVSVPGRIATSNPASLYVTPDRSPPALIGVSSVSPFLVDVCFNRPLDPAAAASPENYQVAGATILSISPHPDGHSVQLSLNQPAPNPTVTVRNITDTEGNIMPVQQTIEGITWASTIDVGNPARPGHSFTCKPGDIEILGGGGGDFWDGRDEFRFVYVPRTNDFDVVTRVDRLQPAGMSTKAGLMARESLADDSLHLAAWTTFPAPAGPGTYEASARDIPGGPTLEWGNRPLTTLPNAWIRLQRIGNVFNGLYSHDGNVWTPFANTTLILTPQLFVGLAATSLDPALLTEAHFTDFQFLNLPTLISQPRGEVVNPGVTYNFSVLAGGTSPIAYQWRRNGQNIPGANSRILTIHNSTPKDSGIYDVIVSSSGGAVASEPAELVVTSPPLPFTDSFGTGPVVNNQAFIGRGANLTATLQPGEPTHAKYGGGSVWLRWSAPFNGVATFNTRGSSFDTLLAAYTGPALNQLTLLENDDDSGGFASSSITFNATQGTLYHIAVDGFEGDRGNIVLCWELELTPPAPTLLQDPLNRVAQPGQPIEFIVTTAATAAIQWFHNNQPIPGANNPTLQIPAVGPDQTGSYFAEVTGAAGGQIIRSKIAYLELGATQTGVTQDKLEDLYRSIPGTGGGLPNEGGSGGGGPAGVPVAAGTLATRVLNNSNSSTSPGEPLHCGVLGGSTRWFGPLHTADPGMTFEIDTLGSSIDTILAVYAGPNLLFLTNVACAVGPGRTSTVRFPSLPREQYNVTVDGTNGTTGTIVLNYKLGSPPVFEFPLPNPTAPPGTDLSFTAPALGTPAPAYQWQTNGVDLPGATTDTLNFTGLQSSDSGTYSLIASNFMGTTTNSAVLIVGHPFFLEALPNPTNQTLLVSGPTNSTNTYILQATVDFHSWDVIWTNSAPETITNYFDIDSLYFPHRFYRAIPWP